MKSCPVGAIVRTDELKVIAQGFVVAIECTEGYIDSETRPNHAFHDAAYLKSMRALKESLAAYRRCLHSVNRVIALTSEKAS
ncbi:MAG TPA: hypothetical protein VGP89_18230 [Candidatus Angelobacter sp.]|jgi:hypothetical protein|nr:hypothetical protein [Candidatus Angelobacter sp.]